MQKTFEYFFISFELSYIIYFEYNFAMLYIKKYVKYVLLCIRDHIVNIDKCILQIVCSLYER